MNYNLTPTFVLITILKRFSLSIFRAMVFWFRRGLRNIHCSFIWIFSFKVTKHIVRVAISNSELIFYLSMFNVFPSTASAAFCFLRARTFEETVKTIVLIMAFNSEYIRGMMSRIDEIWMNYTSVQKMVDKSKKKYRWLHCDNFFYF